MVSYGVQSTAQHRRDDRSQLPEDPVLGRITVVEGVETNQDTDDRERHRRQAGQDSTAVLTDPGRLIFVIQGPDVAQAVVVTRVEVKREKGERRRRYQEQHSVQEAGAALVGDVRSALLGPASRLGDVNVPKAFQQACRREYYRSNGQPNSVVLERYS